jgi:hypothetical protein
MKYLYIISIVLLLLGIGAYDWTSYCRYNDISCVDGENVGTFNFDLVDGGATQIYNLTTVGMMFQPIITNLDKIDKPEIAIWDKDYLRLYNYANNSLIQVKSLYLGGWLQGQPTSTDFDLDNYNELVFIQNGNFTVVGYDGVNMNIEKTFDFEGMNVNTTINITSTGASSLGQYYLAGVDSVSRNMNNIKCTQFDDDVYMDCLFVDEDGIVHSYDYDSNNYTDDDTNFNNTNIRQTNGCPNSAGRSSGGHSISFVVSPTFTYSGSSDFNGDGYVEMVSFCSNKIGYNFMTDIYPNEIYVSNKNGIVWNITLDSSGVDGETLASQPVFIKVDPSDSKYQLCFTTVDGTAYRLKCYKYDSSTPYIDVSIGTGYSSSTIKVVQCNGGWNYATWRYGSELYPNSGIGLGVFYTTQRAVNDNTNLNFKCFDSDGSQIGTTKTISIAGLSLNAGWDLNAQYAIPTIVATNPIIVDLNNDGTMEALFPWGAWDFTNGKSLNLTLGDYMTITTNSPFNSNVFNIITDDLDYDGYNEILFTESNCAETISDCTTNGKLKTKVISMGTSSSNIYPIVTARPSRCIKNPVCINNENNFYLDSSDYIDDMNQCIYLGVDCYGNASSSNDVVWSSCSYTPSVRACNYSEFGNYDIRYFISDAFHGTSINLNDSELLCLTGDECEINVVPNNCNSDDYPTCSNTYTPSGIVGGGFLSNESASGFDESYTDNNGTYTSEEFNWEKCDGIGFLYPICPVWLLINSGIGGIDNFIWDNFRYFIIMLIIILLGVAIYMKVKK